MPRLIPTRVKPPCDEVPLLIASTVVSKVSEAVSSTATIPLLVVPSPSDRTRFAEALVPLWVMV